MKISNSMMPVGNVTASDAKARISKDQGNAAVSDGGAKVELSSFSASMQQMESAMANTPVVDSQKVAEVKQAISEGRFQVHAEKIADGLISSVQQMLKAQ